MMPLRRRQTILPGGLALLSFLLATSVLAVAGAAAPPAAPAQSNPPHARATAETPVASSADDCEDYEISAGDRPSLHIVNLHGTLVVRARNGRLSVTLDGREVTGPRMRREGPLVEVLSEDDRTLFVFGYFPRRGPGPDGQLVHSPTFDPASAQRLLGMTFSNVGDDEAALAGAPAAELIKVGRVCVGGPAESAGLVPGTLLRGAEAGSPFDVADLTRRLAPGRSVRLRVAVPRAGKPIVWETLSVTASEVRAWPPFETLRARFEEAVGS